MVNKEFKKVFERINEKIEEAYKPKNEVAYIEVTEHQWNVLLTYPDFENETKKGNANLGGYPIVKGEKFQVHTADELFRITTERIKVLEKVGITKDIIKRYRSLEGI